MFELIVLVHYLLNIYMWIIVIASLLTWVRADTSHPIVAFLLRITLPVFDFLRQRLPLQFRGMDFAPLVVIIALSILDRFLIGGF